MTVDTRLRTAGGEYGEPRHVGGTSTWFSWWARGSP